MRGPPTGSSHSGRLASKRRRRHDPHMGTPHVRGTRGRLGALACLTALACISPACANRETGGAPAVKVGVDVGLRRGGSWTTFNIRPSRVIGSTTSLGMKKGKGA